MFEHMSEEEAKKQILNAVSEYCDTFHNQKKEFKKGDRIAYASRVYARSGRQDDFIKSVYFIKLYLVVADYFYICSP